MDGSVLSRYAVSVSSGCYNQVPYTGGLHNKHSFLTALEAEKSEIKAPAGSVSGESSLLGSLCPHREEEARELSEVLSQRA